MRSRKRETKPKKAKKSGSKKIPQATKRTAKSATAPRNGEKRAPVRSTRTSPDGLSAFQASPRALLESEQRYKEFAHSLPQVVFETDEKGNLTFVNRSALERYGYTKEDFDAGLSVVELIVPEDRERVRKDIRRRLRGEELASEEYTALRKDGSTFPIVAHSIPVIHESKVVGLRGMLLDTTERKEVEEKLVEANKLLETLLDHTHMMVAYLDTQFNFVRVNRAYAEADGQVPSFFPGKNHFDLYPNRENEEIFRRVVETGKPYFASARPFQYAEHPERGVTYWDWSLIPIKDSATAVTGLVLTLVNVTERHQAEEALKSTHDELEIRVKERTEELTDAIRELQAQVAERKRAEKKVRVSEEKYKTLIETSSDMIFTVDLKGNFLFTNQAFEKSLGYSAEEMQKINGFNLVHPEDLEKVREQFAALVEGKSVDNMEYKYKARDGSYVSILNNASPVLDSEGNVVAALGVARDITARKRAEKALQESELWMRNMFNSLEEAVLVVTPDRTLVNINQAAQKMFGYTKTELADLSTEVLHVDHEHYVGFGARIKEAFDKEETANFEFEAKRKNGEIFPTEHTVSLLKNDKGESLGIVSVVTDISERKRAEEELKQYREHLEELVEERTAELRRANERLEQEITERKQAEEELAWELAVNRELARLSGALIIPSSSIDGIADIVLDSAKSLTQSEHGYVSSIDPITRDHVAHTLTKMMRKQCLVRGEDKRIRFPIGGNGQYQSLWGHALNTREAFLTNCPDKHEASRGIPEGHIPIRNFLSAPAVVGEELLGQIALANSPKDYNNRHLKAIKRLAGLYAIAIQRRQAEEELQIRTYELGERVKELNCFYGIANLVQKPGISLEQILKGTVELIPPAWQYPEITCARIVLEGQVFRTSNFRETIGKQASDIIVHGVPVGTIEVYLLEEKPERHEGPFLKEEQSLISAIAERLSRIVERKKAEEEIQKLNKSLKAQATELAAANKELKAFSYSVSHDLRAPLRALQGFSRALVEDYSDKFDEEGKDYVRRIRGAAQHMGQLIDDLLNLSLVIRKPMRREKTNLSELARAITAELQKTQPERKVSSIIQEGVSAYGDPRLLQEVLENLLSNAWKFTGKHAQAKIEFGATQKEERTVYFVRDNGAGFDTAYVDKLFVPFQRLHSTSEFSGNGIGLAIAARIIGRHGGRIWAEGKVEKGATFYFTLK